MEGGEPDTGKSHGKVQQNNLNQRFGIAVSMLFRKKDEGGISVPPKWYEALFDRDKVERCGRRWRTPHSIC